MHFRIINNNGIERFVRAKSKAEGARVYDRLYEVKAMGKIKSFAMINFKSVTPDEVLKVEEGA